MALRLSQVEFLALVAVARLGEAAHAGAVRADIAARGGRRVSVAGVYAALDRLLAARLARVWLADPRPERGGRGRRHYELTADGRAWLTHAHAQTQAIWRGVSVGGRRDR